ncbi:hypothetical protein NLX71_10475 [Paenibacillus sp. MZ04-78.2]|nr:hypothetical protein [Paenibacillus sp. MZ04-78.2]MCP3773736.1 hypothetical protein [Paenibacillus sp. MZ04-78.2]
MQDDVTPRLELSELTALTSTSRSKWLFAINMFSLHAEDLPPNRLRLLTKAFMLFSAIRLTSVAALMSAGEAIGGEASIRKAFGRETLRRKAFCRETKARVCRINRFHFNIQIEMVVCHKYFLPSCGGLASESFAAAGESRMKSTD